MPLQYGLAAVARVVLPSATRWVVRAGRLPLAPATAADAER